MVSITCFTPKVAYMRNIFPLMVCSKEKLTIAYVKKKKKKTRYNQYSCSSSSSRNYNLTEIRNSLMVCNEEEKKFSYTLKKV